MSRISGESWVRETVLTRWKRFAASVTAFAHRYRTDLFVRTEVNIIVLETGYAVLILLLAIGALFILYEDIVSGVISAVQAALTATTTPVTSESIVAPLEVARTNEVVGVALLIISAAGLFGYLIARLALAPARGALAAQKQFIGNVAHELRTPLSIIKTNTEVRLLDADVPEEARRAHESNLEEMDRISDIINNLLSVNALLRPEQVRFDRVDVVAIALRVVERLRPLTKRKPLRLRVAALRRRIAWGNAAAIEQILMNTVKNAIHHTEKGEIVIAVAQGLRGDLLLSIRDSGSGIRREDLHRIFEPFYRGDNARTRSGGAGSGLGLAIVNELVKLHRGRVSVQSAPGKGTTVTVTFPRKEGALEEDGDDMDEVSADFTEA
ncbi:MAG: HAMP domain-containing histidine kinase [Patescibacteria group bacterium]|nr:HAMP domain-containing histidine kinase [Patescibacteria group bacterium]MDE1965747.1 HAMP domain-containing histidine kinase [Patescibacteria group bacterium]